MRHYLYRCLRTCVILIPLFLGCRSVSIAQVGVSSGQSFGSGSIYQATPVRTQAVVDIIKLDNGLKFSLAPELITDIIHKPHSGYLAGAGISLRPSYTFDGFDKLTIFGLGGAGLTYFGISTVEQGDPGFNFLDHIGGGLEFRVTDFLSLEAAYRFSHLSDAGIRVIPNRGINANNVLLGFNIKF